MRQAGKMRGMPASGVHSRLRSNSAVHARCRSDRRSSEGYGVDVVRIMVGRGPPLTDFSEASQLSLETWFRSSPVSLFFHVLRNEGVELFASGTILFVLEVPRQFASYYFHQVLWRFSLREPTRVNPRFKCIPQINMIA
jgi:hypothetical protein